MNRTIVTLAGVLGASSLLLVDSAIKGTVLLALAAVAALILKRDSAATRHLVWLLAIVALLVVPLLSALLPEWRVLPAWASHSPQLAVVDISPTSIVRPADVAVELPKASVRVEVERPISMAELPATQLPESQVAIATPKIDSESTVWSWITALPLVWAIGFCVFILRLSAARWMLRNSERRATVIWPSSRGVGFRPADDRDRTSDRLEAYPTNYDPIVIAMETICSQLGISRPVTLLIHRDKTIPVVWGILHCRLMLPAAARQWSDEQLRSVLLHELAHVKRRDTLVQLLAQVACALHWFNPLVWFAAWRLDVERERACDDLVLVSGVRPSAYAGHLLNVVTGLSPARWTQSCGLAMARQSSLEGRLTAVLGKDLNRRGVSVALAGLALAVAVGIAVPIAMLRAADEKWNPPQVAHVGSNDLSTFCIHDGKDTSFVIAYLGDFGSATESSSNPKTRTWTDSGTLTAKKPGIALGFHRTHTAPGKLSITIAPAEGRDLSKPAPSPRKCGKKQYDLTKGRVFLLSDSGDVRQFDIAAPVVTDQVSAKKLVELIAAIPPQEREDFAPTPNHIGKLALETIAKLKWGEPVNGLRMALAWPPAFDEELLGTEPFFQLVVQNVSEGDIHFATGDNAPNPRELVFIANDRTVLVIADKETAKAEWHLQPGRCGVLRMFTNEECDDDGKTVSAGIEGDLSKIDRNRAIAEMEIATAPAGAWTGKLVTGPTRGSADVAAAPAPMHKDARALYEIWQRHARGNGDIPGGLVGELAGGVRRFMRYNPTWKTVPTLNALLPRLDGTRDWKPADAIALLDEIAAIQDSPLSMALDDEFDRVVRTGKPLPNKLAEALGVWGPHDMDGLRVAWELEPRRDLHVEWAKHVGISSTAALGEALKARLFVHNSGKKPIVVRVPTFLQCEVKAGNVEGKAVECVGIEWTTLSRLYTCRLAPGEYVEVNTPGIGFGKDAGRGPWAGPRTGWNVLTQPGGSVRLEHAPVPLDGSESGRREDPPFADGPDWWSACIKARLARELPLPADATERVRLLDRAANDLFGSSPTAEEREAFAKVTDDKSLAAFAAQLAQRPGLASFFGKLRPVATWFKITAADPNADKQPRVVLGPGEYPLPTASARRGDATLKIVGRPVGDRHTNDAQILFEAAEATGRARPDPHKLEVPDGWGTWAIVCRPNDGYFYLLHKGGVRKIDYSGPRKVTDTPTNDLPTEFRDEVKRQLDIAGVSDAQQAEIFEKPAAAPAASLRADEQEKPKTAATELPPKTTEQEPFTAWGKEINGLQAGLGFKAGEQRVYRHGETVTLVVRVRNVGQNDIKFKYYPAFLSGNSPTVLDETGKRVSLRGNLLRLVKRDVPKEVNLAVGKEIELYERVLRPAKGNEDADELRTRDIFPSGKFLIQHEQVIGNSAQASEKLDPGLENLATGKLELEVKEPEKLPPEKEPVTAWGKEVGGLQAGLGFNAGENRAYTPGEWATLVVRVRNVGKDEVKFQYLRQFFVEQPPIVFNEKGELKQLGRTIAFGVHIPVEVKLAAGKEIELYELKIYLGTGSEEGIPKYPYIFGMGKFHVQYEKVLGNSSSASIKLDPALGKLATGKLELEIKPVAPERPEAPKPKQGAKLERAMLEGSWAGEKDGVMVHPAVKDLVLTRQPNAEKQEAAGGMLLKPATEQKLKWGEPVNGLRAALAMHPMPDLPDAEDHHDIFLVGSIIAASIRVDFDFDLTGKMEIATAPTGTWKGKLLSGEIKGGTAVPVISFRGD